MNIVFDPRFLAKSYKPNEMTEEAKYRLKIIDKYYALRQEGLSDKKALAILEVKRSTFYRWKKLFISNKYKKSAGLANKSRRPNNFRISKAINHELVSHVLEIRQAFPMWGKIKITKMLQKNGYIVSESTIGRILTDLIKRKKILPVPLLKGKNKRIRNCIKKRYAQRWKFQKAKELGEMIQIDHMDVTVNSHLRIKEFKAICPISRIVVSKLYFKATARNGRDFLKHLQKTLPFKVKSIQTDGGSEFMKEFEQYCKDENIKMYVLPPRSPKHNGKVERANETYRYEFYNSYELPDTMEELKKEFEAFEYHYNNVRPHQALGNLTPMEFYDKIKNKIA